MLTVRHRLEIFLVLFGDLRVDHVRLVNFLVELWLKVAGLTQHSAADIAQLRLESALNADVGLLHLLLDLLVCPFQCGHIMCTHSLVIVAGGFHFDKLLMRLRQMPHGFLPNPS